MRKKLRFIPMKSAIIIMAKVPIAGLVKTRLQPFFTPIESAELATCLLQDTANKAQIASKNVILAYSPNDGENHLRKLVGSEILFIPQTGEGLGERIICAFVDVFVQDFDCVLMIGTDSPSISASLLETAFAALKNCDSVIGETLDGGFYLIGLKRFIPEIFDGVEWSSSKTFLQTLSNINKIDLSVFQLPILYDVDTPKDIELLMNDKNIRGTAPQTFQYLSTKKDAKP
jgi:uncharacterized protein